MTTETRYVPAAGRAAFTRLYDPVVAVTMREARFRGLLVDGVLDAVPADGTVVDLGCGTGTFALRLAAALPAGRIVGIDGDPEVLAIAGGKPGAERVDWRAGRVDATGLPPGSAHAVVLSLVLHHLDAATKHAALTEARRVLRPGGTLHVADWGRPADPLTWAGFTLLRALDGFDTTREHAAGRIPALVTDAGFDAVARTARLRTAWGSLELLRAVAR